jgi:hypothetical protein
VWSRVLLVAIVAVLAVGCSSAERPSVTEWQPTWDRIVGSFPTIDELGDPPDTTICNETLVALRTTSGDLQPTPDRALDDPVRSWVELAEEIVFDCPPGSSAIPSLEYAYDELTLLEAEVDGALSVEPAD